MFIDFLLETFERNKEKDAIIWKDGVYSYKWLLGAVEKWRKKISTKKISSGTVTILETDFSPNSVALFMALIEHGCILVPLTSSVETKKPDFIKTAQGEISFAINENDHSRITKLPYSAGHDLYQILRESNHPGLVLFSSGSTGESKAALHDFLPILDKFKVHRRRLRTITFLLYDHIGGVNTLLYTLSNGGCIVTVEDRGPDTVLGAVEKYRVELLPTSPTFINLILLSEAYKRHSLDSLKTVTYGTEPMPESTLRRFHELFPNIDLLQTYGLSEVGILHSKSKDSHSLWVKVGGEGFETRVKDGRLQIKARSAMLGYLNADSPFTEDGWLDTGDSVEVDGEYLKILGRESEIINVGGEKVYPAEVESIIQEMENVAEVTVYGEKNPITGNIVCARVKLLRDEDHKSFVHRLKKYCRERLERYKIPVKVKILDEKQHSERFKKVRI